jgi:hypothetical protein
MERQHPIPVESDVVRRAECDGHPAGETQLTRRRERVDRRTERVDVAGLRIQTEQPRLHRAVRAVPAARLRERSEQIDGHLGDLRQAV